LVAAWNHPAHSSFCLAFDFINKHQPHGSRPKPLKDAMQTITYTKPAKVLSHPVPKKQHKPAATWQPQQTSLTREEIRAIIIDQIG
jgi:hypothetical protein